MRARTRLLSSLALCLFAAACQLPPDGPAGGNDVGVVRVALFNVPTNGTCLRFTAMGGPRTVTQRVDATSGADLMTTLGGLPFGPALSISADAFAGTCAQLKDDSLATYQSDIQTVTLATGETKALTFTLRPTGNVTGTVDFVYLTMAPTAFSYGNIVIMQPGPIGNFTFKNIGLVPTSPLTTTLNVTSGTAADFTITTNTCTGMLMPGMVCTVAVRMNPMTAGPKNASLTMSALQGGTLTAMLVGVGWNPAKLTMTPPSAAFGNTPLFTPSSTVDFTVTNTGDQPTGPIMPSFSSGDFMLFQNQCPGILPGLQSCHLLVRFLPPTTGTRTGTMTVAASPGGVVTASLSGVGVSPLTISPTTFAFGSATVGTAGMMATFTVTNTGAQASIPLTTVAAPSPFRIITNGCVGKTLTPGAGCPMTLQFYPTGAGALSGSLTVNGALNWSAAATLSGTGI
jgi:hypothetical protein